jgi:hypothetical protein
VVERRPVRKFNPELGDDFPIDELLYYEDDPAATEPWNQVPLWPPVCQPTPDRDREP